MFFSKTRKGKMEGKQRLTPSQGRGPGTNSEEPNKLPQREKDTHRSYPCFKKRGEGGKNRVEAPRGEGWGNKSREGGGPLMLRNFSNPTGPFKGDRAEKSKGCTKKKNHSGSRSRGRSLLKGRGKRKKEAVAEEKGPTEKKKPFGRLTTLGGGNKDQAWGSRGAVGSGPIQDRGGKKQSRPAWGKNMAEFSK